MAKKKPEITIKSYGLYTRWDRSSKALPKVIKHTREVPATLDIEFGYTLEIRGAKGSKISFIMKHPPFLNEAGEVAADFIGEDIINSNEWYFFLGDTVWEPIEDKCGEWELITFLDSKEIARMKFNLYLPPAEPQI